MIITSTYHTPVLLPQVIRALEVKKGKKYIDTTLGGGGYVDEILKLGGIVLGIDADESAIEYSRHKYQKSNSKHQINKDIFLVHGNFRDLHEIAHSQGFDEVFGIIFDLGMSTYQLEGSKKGFSYAGDEILDMRMDIRQNLTAADLLNRGDKEKLYEIFTKYAEELHSRAIVDAIVCARAIKKITNTGELVKLIETVIKKDQFYHSTKARIFQALRIAVNDELNNLERGLTDAIGLLAKTGKIAVLSYHSLEDRIVKLKLKNAQDHLQLKILTHKPVRASFKETQENSKAKSAKLRIAEKTGFV